MSEMARTSRPTRSIRQSPHRKARDVDRLRLILERIAHGEDADEATWKVLSGPQTGIARFIKRALAGDKPSPQRLLVARTALISRVSPDLVAAHREEATAVLAAGAPKVAAALVTSVVGKRGEGVEPEEGGGLSAQQVAAAKLVLQAARVIETGKSSTTVNAVQVNLPENHEGAVAEAMKLLEGARSGTPGESSPDAVPDTVRAEVSAVRDADPADGGIPEGTAEYLRWLDSTGAPTPDDTTDPR